MKHTLWMSSAAAALFLTSARQVSADMIYSNGPVNGTIGTAFFTGADSQSISDSFTVSSPSSITSATGVGLWVDPGATPSSLTWSIGTSSFGNDIASGNVTPTNVLHNIGNFYVYSSSFTLSGVPVLAAGTYWLTLSNGVASDGGLIGWDINNGPSTAFANFVTGSIPSESFTLNGSAAGAAVPEPSSVVLWAHGGLFLAAAQWRRRRCKQAVTS